MRKIRSKILSFLLSLSMLVAMAPTVSLPAYADSTVNVATAEALKAALEADGDKTIKLTADVVLDIYNYIALKGKKTLKLSGHKIELTNEGGFDIPAEASLKIDGKADGSGITSTKSTIFYISNGSLTIDGGTYTNSHESYNVVYVSGSTAGGKIEINGGYFQSVACAIHSYSKKVDNPPEVIINGGTFVSKSYVWDDYIDDATKGVVNRGTFFSQRGIGVFNFFGKNTKFLGDGKYLVSDGEHNTSSNLWETHGRFIQVGNSENDFVNVRMNIATGGKGYFFNVGPKDQTVLAMKNSILPVVAVPDAGKIFSDWEKVSGAKGFLDPGLINAYYIPEADSELKPNFAAAPPKPTLKIIGTYKYNGSEQTADVSGYDPVTMNISGNKRITAGISTISVTPKGPEWADGNTDAATVEWTIEKASCTGEPSFTAITSAGKTLADANLGIGTISPAGGTIKWDLPDTSAVMQGVSYNWTYTPADAANYEKFTGSIVPYPLPVNVATAAELQAALKAPGGAIVNLTADVVWRIAKTLDVKDSKVLKLNGHKIENEGTKFLFYLPDGCNLKVDGSVKGSAITAKNNSAPVIFNVRGGALTIDGGEYTSFKNIVDIGTNSKDATVTITDGYFQATAKDCGILHSQSAEALNPPNIHINGGTFVSESFVWTSTDNDESKGVVNGGSFYSKEGKKVFNLKDTYKKYLGAGKYLVADGAHNANPNVWELDGSFIQVGDSTSDFVDVTMNAAAGGKGYFFKKNGKEGTVAALKDNILPVVAVPDAGNAFSSWKKVSGAGSFETGSLAEAYYVPKDSSKVSPVFTVAKPTLGIIGTYKYNGSEQTANVSGYDPDTMNIEGNKKTDAGTYTVKVTPKGGTWAGGSTEAATVAWTIDKADIGGNNFTKMIRQGITTQQNVTKESFGISKPGIFSSNGVVTDSSNILDGAVLYGNTVKFTLKASAAAGDKAIVPVTFTPDDSNYGPKSLILTIKVSDKSTPVVNVEDIKVTYSGSPVDKIKIKGKARFEGSDVPGSFDWKSGQSVTNVSDSGSKTVVFTPDDTGKYASVEANLMLTINKKSCTGAPSFTSVTGAGKTLADANLGIGTISPAGGAIKWNLPDSTSVVQGTSYAWTYTPTDAANYKNLTGSVTPWAASGGGNTGGGSSSGGGTGGGGGGGDAGGSAPTYAVTVEKPENGSVSSSHGSAAEGTTVVLTVTPDKGYILDKLTVLDSKDKKIDTTKNADKYSFKMPSGKVSVKATFKKGEEQPGANAADNEVKFTDVKDSDYFAKAVAWAVEKGITTGTSATLFSPNAPCTRAQTVAFLWRAAGKPEPQKTDNPFADVKADAYYNKALLWALEQGIVNGTSATSFSPNATCTRAQMAALLYRYAKSPEVKGGKSFADVKEGAYYANAVKWAAEQGITSGTSATSFSPYATCTRAQIVTFLYRYMVK